MDTPETLIARLEALIAKWRELARLARPLDSAPLTAQKRMRVAEWIHYSNRASELEGVLKAHALSGATPTNGEASVSPPSEGWQPIATAPKDGTMIIGALIIDGKVWRVHDMEHNGLAFYTINGGSLPQMTHWIPAPQASAGTDK